MDVCVLSDGYPPWERGGAQKIAAQLARGYGARGHRVSVVTTVTDRDAVGRSTVDGVEVTRLYTPKPSAVLPYLTVYNPFVVGPCRRALDRIDPDVVHAHNCHWLSNGALRAAGSERPLVKTYHDAGTVAYGDYDAFVDDVPVGRSQVSRRVYEVDPGRQLAEQGLRYNPIRNRSNRRRLREAVDVGVAVSRELQRALRTNGMPCDRVVHNGVDPTVWESGNGTAFRDRYDLADERLVLFGGRTSRVKGGRHVAAAVARLVAETDYPLGLVVTGDDDFVPEMRRAMGPHGDALLSTGWIDDATYRDAVAAATVVASPSVFLDPFPTVNLEAFAARTPVVTTRFGGARELVDHGEDGFVVDPRDVDSLADALGALLGDPATAAAFGRAGRRKATDEFRAEAFVAAYLDLLSEVVDGRPERAIANPQIR